MPASSRSTAPTARGVDWNSEESHEKRHLQFLRLLGDERDASILDLGCGYGDFLGFLRARGFSGSYTGYDISTDMIMAARRRHGEGADRRWCVGAIPSEASDYAIASGILNVKGDTPIDVWAGYVRDTIDVLACAGRRGFAFNILTLSSDPALRRPISITPIRPRCWLTVCRASGGRPRCCRITDCGSSQRWSAIRRLDAAFSSDPAPVASVALLSRQAAGFI